MTRRRHQITLATVLLVALVGCAACPMPAEAGPGVVILDLPGADLSGDADDTPDAVDTVGPADAAEDDGPDVTTADTPIDIATPPCTPQRAIHTVSFGAIAGLAAARCSGDSCHTGGGTAGGLSLDAEVLHGNTVGVKAKNSPLLRIAPGAPTQSYLYLKVTGAGTFQRMPRGGPYLPAADIADIRRWIEDCARADAVEGAPTEPVP